MSYSKILKILLKFIIVVFYNYLCIVMVDWITKLTVINVKFQNDGKCSFHIVSKPFFVTRKLQFIGRDLEKYLNLRKNSST